ncbi:MAG: toll/interleukin-1 receptor domain-containing protein [Rhodoglobus sp.]
MPIDVEKLALLRSIAKALGERDLADANLVLHEAGLEEASWNDWYDERWEPTDADRANAVLRLIRDLPRSTVDELAIAVRELYEVSIEVRGGDEPEPLQLFASHLASQKAIVGAVGDELARWGVTLFVAHDSIEPDQEWQAEIERALRTSHAGIVFLFPDFEKSSWCDQEVGWLLGREIPCYALKFQGRDPYGPLGKKQAFTVHDEMTASDIAGVILAWLATKPELASSLNGSYVQALKASRSFNRTDRVWDHLRSATGMGASQVAGLLTAIRDNDQVYNAHHAAAEGVSGPYAELIFGLALEQPGFSANDELAKEVARIRGLEALLPAPPTTEPDVWGTATSTPF